ncbi:uncharacterized protein MELLADRAFT_108215 [Melampsora larici-populina 98AG31]|uniref:F-box domain-containing protein n=1 Tax=Melampsora larici-populina (strain 98AG31 / pathotype 3-4-7) TaxID=747676 RepID=F4RSC6_MELLP|nr:uncharacterized protein MELLADRAFT_108215 [Melampsora larici-populina 98AG31]EGG04574.1 hypothetical protein MELLADRAFT_108215 [Melampsora larici-populina 98AG31]
MCMTSLTFPHPFETEQLPVEGVRLIVENIINQSPIISADPTNCTDTSFLHHTQVTRLLQLRLLSKAWDIVILDSVFKNLRLPRDNMASSLAGIWKTSYLTPGFPKLQRLCLDGVQHPMPLSRHGQPLPSPTPVYPFSIRPQNAASIISLCRYTLTQLKLRFIDCVGFTPELSNTIQLATGLHTLNISGSRSSGVPHDSKSIKFLLERIPQLKSLSLNFSFLSAMELARNSLPDLEHFWFACDLDNLQAAKDICQSSARKISCLELLPQANPDPIAPIALGLQDILQVLFIISIPDRIPRDSRDTCFPKLRVLRSEYCHSNPLEIDLQWLKWPLLQSIEVLVTSYWHGNVYWRSILAQTDRASITVPPKLKHIVFTTPEGSGLRDQELVEVFQSIGVKCHFMFQPACADLMGLANLLNTEELRSNDVVDPN